MTEAEYLVGVLLSVCALGAVTGGAVAVRARILPGWTGPPARLAEATMGVAIVIVAAGGLGVAGAFERFSVAIGCFVSGVATWVIVRRIPVERFAASKLPLPGRPGSLEIGAVVVVVALIGSQWGYFTWNSVDEGMLGNDTLYYHGPVAARFVQDATVWPLHFTTTNGHSQFFPYNSELLHGVGVLFFENDVVSPFLTLGWLALALTAGWCIGRPHGVGPAALVGVAVVACVPRLVETQPGEAYNDIMVLALALTAAALLINGGLRPGPVLFAGTAAGLALGTKLSAIPLIGALSLGVLALMPRGQRRNLALLWLVPLLATGALWYVRNLALAGTPLPGMPSLGPLDLPSPELPDQPAIAGYLFESGSWQRIIFPGLRTQLGLGWWLILLLALGGMASAIVAGASNLVRMLGAVGLVSVVAHLFTPGTAYLTSVVSFGGTLRYVMPALALGLALLPVVWLRGRSAQRWALLVLVLLLAWTFTEAGPGLLDRSRVALGLVIVAMGCVAVAVQRRSPGLWRPALIVIIAAACLVGWRLQAHYLEGRYAEGDLAWANDLEDARIALVNTDRLYTLYGRTLSNRVEYVGERTAHGGYRAVHSCPEWRVLLNRGRYRYVVIAPLPLFGPLADPRVQALQWTRSDPGASLVFAGQTGEYTVFELRGPLDPGDC